MSANGPTTWTQPIFTDPVPPIVVNGQAVEALVESYSASHRDPQGVFVETSGGQHAAHTLFESSAAPITIAPRDIDLELPQMFEDVRRHLDVAAARARAHTLELWLDLPYRDSWEGDASRTTFTLTRSTGYGSTGVTWANRPARCWIDATEKTMVTGAPSAGECQLSQTADATQIVMGDVAAAGAIVTLSYYPVMVGSLEVEEDMDDLNSGTVSLTFEEALPVRSYG